MPPLLHPWQLLSVILAGIISEQQQLAIDYLKEENRVLREQLGDKRLRLTDEQRRRLAVKGNALGRKLLAEICCIVTPDTILRWHRKLIAQKYDGSDKRRPGRPRVMEEIRCLVVRLATENRGWGYDRIGGELRKLGHRVSHGTVANILRQHGLEPAPSRVRGTTWAEFLRAHWGCIAAVDFFTFEAWTARGLTRIHVLFVIDLATRRVEIAGILPTPHGAWVERRIRDLLDGFDGFLRPHRFLIHDRDPLFTSAMAELLRAACVQPVRLPPRSPNLNTYAERFVGSIRRECLDRVILFGERHLRRAIGEYVEHYNRERPHQGVGNIPLEQPDEPPDPVGTVVCDERLGGLLRSYRRAA